MDVGLVLTVFVQQMLRIWISIFLCFADLVFHNFFVLHLYESDPCEYIHEITTSNLLIPIPCAAALTIADLFSFSIRPIID